MHSVLLYNSPNALRLGVAVTYWVTTRKGTKHPLSPGRGPGTESFAPKTTVHSIFSFYLVGDKGYHKYPNKLGQKLHRSRIFHSVLPNQGP